MRLHRGFWGNVADGAVFKTMSYIGGRRKPRATERSESLLKINTAPLNEAEAVVRIFNDAIEQGYQENSPVLRERLRSRLARPGLEFRHFSTLKYRRSIAPTKTCWRNGRNCRWAAAWS